MEDIGEEAATVGSTTSTFSGSHEQLAESLGFGNGSLGGYNLSSIESSDCEFSDEHPLNTTGFGHPSSNESMNGFFPRANATSFEDKREGIWCNRNFDGAQCWQATPENTSVTLPCFESFRGVRYTGSVSRVCELGGIWQKTNYSSCHPLTNQHPQDSEENMTLGVTIHVYLFGYCLSLAALIAAMIIFLSFKRQLPWSTSKVRKLFQASSSMGGTAEQTEIGDYLNDRHSAAEAEARQRSSDLEKLTPSVSALATILMGKMVCSSLDRENEIEKTALEKVQQEELELRCLRNKIHIQLILTYILAAALWIITKTNFSTMSTTFSQKDNVSVSSQVSCVTFILLHYFHLTNFFWMFVEGLYLYVLVVQTFTTKNIKLRVYTLIGWGIPFLVVGGWLFVKWIMNPPVPKNNTPGEGELNASCVWVVENVYDWFYKVPALMVLLANIVFLLRIMWVLITKLRSATNPETQQSRKAAKAFVVLMPLLGIIYVFVLAGPRESPAYEHIRALLISTQGFLVALLYCFLNGEVRTAVRHRWSRISPSDCPFNLGRCCGWENGRRRHLQHVRDSSPNCRTESIRLYTPAPDDPGKRDSMHSELSQLTTTTSLHSGLGHSGSGGGGGSLWTHNGTNNVGIGIQPPLSAAAVKRLSALSTTLEAPATPAENLQQESTSNM